MIGWPQRAGVKRKIALIDWAGGLCGSVTKTGDAVAAGAIGAIIVAVYNATMNSPGIDSDRMTHALRSVWCSVGDRERAYCRWAPRR